MADDLAAKLAQAFTLAAGRMLPTSGYQVGKVTELLAADLRRLLESSVPEWYAGYDAGCRDQARADAQVAAEALQTVAAEALQTAADARRERLAGIARACPSCGRSTARSEAWSSGQCDDCHAIDAERPRHGRTCSSDPEIGCECGLADWQADHPEADLERAARALVTRLEHITTEEFAHGGERAEREALAAALGMDRPPDIIRIIPPRPRPMPDDRFSDYGPAGTVR